MTEVHVIPDERTTWRVYDADADAPLSEHTNATEAELAAQARAEDQDAERVVVHDRYHRTHDAPRSPAGVSARERLDRASAGPRPRARPSAWPARQPTAPARQRSGAMTAAVHESPCPRCDRLVSVTLATSETSDQLAAEHSNCPHCGARLVRAIEGHADRGWRVDEPDRRLRSEPEMPEQHQIAGHARAEALPAGRVGVRVTIPLSGCPSRRWSLDLAARLANELVGHRAVGHLKLNDVVQGDQLVLDGVEEAEAPLLSDALARALDSTNADCQPGPSGRPNVSQPDADTIASKIA